MQAINSGIDLKIAILSLEAEHQIKGQLLKDQLLLTYESLKPVNLLKNSLAELSTSPHITDNLSGTAIGLISGFLSKKLIVGTSGNIIRKIIGDVLQFGVTNVVTQNSGVIKSAGLTLLKHLVHKKTTTKSVNLQENNT